MLRDRYSSKISLLHVADDEATGRTFLSEWAAGHGLEDAELLVDTGDDVDCSVLLAEKSRERNIFERLLEE